MIGLQGRPRRRPATHRIWRHTYSTKDGLASAVSERALSGDVVRICRRYGLDSFDVVQNDVLFLVRDVDGTPIGSYATILEAIAAGDANLNACNEDDFEPPRGAA